MAEITEYRISDLTAAASLNDSDSLEISQEDAGELTGHISKRTTMLMIANWIATIAQYTSSLQTTSKTLTGAINELKQLISLIPQFSIEVVQTLPTEDISETTIYLVPNSDHEQGNYYEEYIYVNNTWELVGTTAVDLSAYYTKLEVDGLLAAKANTSDVTAALALKEAKADLDDDVTDIVVGLTDEQTTAHGNPVTLTTEQSGGAKSALVTFAPKQSGTGDPSPSNIRPISGWDGLTLTRTGKNIFDKNIIIENGVINAQGEIQIVSTYQHTDYIIVKSNTNYTSSGVIVSLASAYFSVAFYDRDKAFISRYISDVGGQNVNTFTTPQDTRYIRINVFGPDLNTVQIEEGSTETTYEPYQGESHTTTFAEPVAGGSYDFVSGEGKPLSLVMLTLTGGESYTLYGTTVVVTNSPRITGDTSRASEILCSHTNKVGFSNAQGTAIQFTNIDNVWGVSTAEALKQKMADLYNGGTPCQVLYPSTTTPTPITLTPADVELNKGSNTVWTDGDTVQVKYSELPQGNLGAVIDYIKKLEARIAALET